MPNLPLRDIPAHVHRDLKAAANRNHRSLNGEILARLSASVQLGVGDVDVEALLERVEEGHGTIRRRNHESAASVRDNDRELPSDQAHFEYDFCLSFGFLAVSSG